MGFVSKMDSSDQRIRRKRIFRQSYYSSSSFPSVRFLILCLSFLGVLYVLSNSIAFSFSAFRPVLVVSTISLLSSSSSRTVKSVQNFDSFSFPWTIENRVLFPDHVLLLVSGDKDHGFMNKIDREDLVCVYYDETVMKNKIVQRKVISTDEFDEFRSIVRCPLPSVNDSTAVSLILHGKTGILKEEKDGFLLHNQTVKSWENLAYSAALDGDTVVVFVKGLNLRAGRESDPRSFTCHFGLGRWDRNRTYVLKTKAISAAQEVVRCSLPRSIKDNPDKAKGILVTVGIPPHFSPRAHGVVTLPSIAKISQFGFDEKRTSARKYELCVCTMVWNQAAALREWVMYHSWLGVEKWFIYDNNSDDGIEHVIRDLNSDNYNVTRHVWPWIKTQEAGFSHCAIRAKHECSWVSFMDVDEYFYFPYSTPRHQRFRDLGYAGQHSLRMVVANLSSSFSSIGEIRTSCYSFGPSGLTSPPSQGVTVGYTCRVQSPERHKSIIRPDGLDSSLLNVVHHFRLKKGYTFIDLPQSTSIINHYKYQVWEVFRAKFHRRVATYVADWQENQNEGSRDRAPGLGTEAIEPADWPQRFCEVWDTGLRDFVLSNLADLSTGLLPWETEYALSS